MSNHRITMVIPTYWGRSKKEGWHEGDKIYDHPTPIDEEGTICRIIESIKILKDKEFNLVIIACATHQKIFKEVEEKVRQKLKEIKIPVKAYFFSHSHLKDLKKKLLNLLTEGMVDLLSIYGYANIRNLCLLLPQLLGSEIALLIDDDEIFEDNKFINKAKENIGKRINNEFIRAIAGFYLQPNGSYFLEKKTGTWQTYWDNFTAMNLAFKKFIASSPRLKEVPFVFGGNMLVHRDLFTKVPFDPNITRGEDIDFLLNAKIFGYKFYLDNQLAIKHLAPPKAHPVWRQIREDICRFLYMREKIRAINKNGKFFKIFPEYFDPYPGEFLKDNLEEKILYSNLMLALEYLSMQEKGAALECLHNIQISKYKTVPQFSPLEFLVDWQKRWEKFMFYVEAKRCKLIHCLEDLN